MTKEELLLLMVPLHFFLSVYMIFDNLRVLESDDIILSGSSIARDGKFGNDWVLYLIKEE